MNRSLWTQSLTRKLSPAWPCPVCRKGVLVLSPDSFVDKETAESRYSREVVGDDEITSTFMAWLKCSQPDCGEQVALTGKGTLEFPLYGLNDEGEPEGDPIEHLTPLFCLPMPDIFQLPEKCPTEVKAELRAGFRLFWSDQAASAGRVRISLEGLMDHFHVPKTYVNRKGEDRDFTLHQRIERFATPDAVLKDKLMALKWLGNTASHQGTVTGDDLLDAFEILEYLLAELFDDRSARVADLARQLTKKHGPQP